VDRRQCRRGSGPPDLGRRRRSDSGARPVRRPVATFDHGSVLAVGLGVGQGCGLSRGGPRAAACRVRAGAGCGRVWRWCTGNVVNKCRQATLKTAARVAASARRGIKAALRSAHGFDRSQHRRGGTAASHRSLRQRSGGMHPAAAGPPSSPPVGRGGETAGSCARPVDGTTRTAMAVGVVFTLFAPTEEPALC
jgi:hypothetical protein